MTKGDTLVVSKLDRLGRSLPHLLAIIADLKERGVAFRSLTEQMDTATPQPTFRDDLAGHVVADVDKADDPEHRDRQHLHQGPALGVRRKRGARAQAIGRSRGGQTTKVHALTDVIGRSYALMLTPGNVADVTAAPALLARMGRARYVLGD